MFGDGNPSFNSTLVQLKAFYSINVVYPHMGFNSTLVQLKAYQPYQYKNLNDSFNSTLVQLKVLLTIPLE